MRVAVLNDLPVSGTVTSGLGSGAELTIGRFARAGALRGHEVDVVTPEFCSARALASFDLVVTKNVTGFSREQLGEVAARRFVAWPSDYCWTRWRLFFAFQEGQRRNPSLPFWTDFMSRSVLNVFLSPLHREAYEWAMPGIVEHTSFLSPPMVDADAFQPAPEGWEKDTACTVNGGLPFKGLHQNLSWAHAHPKVRFSFVGSIREQVNLPANARFVGHLPRPEFERFLGRTETYVELPSSVQPYNQSAVQGLLSCRRVETNENLGAASWPWFRAGNRGEVRRVMRGAMEELWGRIEKEAAA